MAGAVDRWLPLIREKAAKYGLPAGVLAGLVDFESGGNPAVRNGASGATGLGQVMPREAGFAGRPTVRELQDPATNLEWSARILADGVKRYGSVEKGLASYLGAIDARGNLTAAVDANGTGGAAYIRNVLQRAQQYGGGLAQAAGAAGQAVSSAAGRAGALIWPVAGARPGSNITNPFGGPQTKTPGYEQVVQSAVNHGLDIGARQGTPVVAPAGSTVVSVGTGTNSGWGNSVLLRDAQGNEHRLSHLRDVPLVKAGQRVGAGQLVGYVGQTGNATGPHLDYEFKPAGGGFANPLSQEFAMGPDAGPNMLTPGGGSPGAAPGAPGAPGGPGGPGKDDQNKPVAEQIRDALARIRTSIASAKYPEDQAKLQATEQALLRDLAALEQGKTGETEAEKNLRNAQADYYKTRAGAEDADREQKAREAADANARAAAQNASAEAIGAARNATDLEQTGMTSGASRYGAELAAGASRYGTDVDASTQRYGYDLSAAQAAANLQWDQEKTRILQAFNEKKFGWEQAVAAATEAKQRLELELTQQRNAIEAAGLDVTQRGQDLSSEVTQRGQNLEAQTTVRGQDIGRLNQAVSSGAGLLGNAMQTAGQIGASTGSTALGALRYYAPANAGEAFNRAGQGQAPGLGTVGMPFDPTTIVQQAADAAYAKYAPPGQALLAQGMGPSPNFVAPGAIAAPARVSSGYAPVQLPPNVLQPGAGGQFVAP